MASALSTTPAFAAPAASAPAPAASAQPGPATSLASLSSNKQTFLNLLLTQLKNQDPTTPVDTNQFTTELVQYSQVEQQINTNAALSQLVSLTQSQDLLQGGSLVGKRLDLSGTTLPLQGGQGTVQFTSPGAELATISIATAAGVPVKTLTVEATAGANTLVWDGTDDSGRLQPDGPYVVGVLGAPSGGPTAPLPFTVLGTATGVARSGTAVSLQLGPTTVDLGSVLSVVN